MMDKIKFGTDGWRGMIGAEFTFANVRRVAAAIAAYVKEEGTAEKGLVVGYDTRFLSPEAALTAAEVIADAGIPVLVADRPTPTPAISYAVTERKAAGAIVITASHNPARWNGVKFKAAYGGSAAPAMVKRIERCLHKLERSRRRPRRARLALIESADLVGSYLERLKTLVHLERVRASGRKFVVDPMFGAGQGCLARLFKEAHIPCEEIHGERNPIFPGMNPEPIEPHIEGLRQAVVKGGHDAGFATDGDADRLGAIDRDGTFIDSHKIFSILLRHLAEDLRLNGEVVKTFSTTRMVDKLARKYGFPLHITPIGFKYICELMLTRNVLIGGEESGGIGVKGHLPERDGVLNALYLAEVMADRGKTLGELVAELTREFGPHFYGRLDLEVELAAAQKFVRQASRLKGKRLAGLKVTAFDDLDGVKLLFGDSAWLLLRASGTENVLRLYAEAPSRE
ncbi:MAG: phosphoglucomutase/phosphomannomutase family protein, partial [Deltaproteobacteria bacterium]